MLQESLALHRHLGDQRDVANVLNSLGATVLEQGNFVQAQQYLDESLVLAHNFDDEGMLAMVLNNLGLVMLEQSDYSRSLLYLRQGLTLAGGLADKHAIASTLEVMAGVAGARGKADRAARIWGAAEALRETVGAPVPPADQAQSERHLAATRTQLDEAAWQQAWAEGRAMPLEQAIAYALVDETSPRVGT